MQAKGALEKNKAVAKVVYGTELVPMSAVDKDVDRKQASWVTWKFGTWVRGVAAIMNFHTVKS